MNYCGFLALVNGVNIAWTFSTTYAVWNAVKLKWSGSSFNNILAASVPTPLKWPPNLFLHQLVIVLKSSVWYRFLSFSRYIWGKLSPNQLFSFCYLSHRSPLSFPFLSTLTIYSVSPTSISLPGSFPSSSNSSLFFTQAKQNHHTSNIHSFYLFLLVPSTNMSTTAKILA